MRGPWPGVPKMSDTLVEFAQPLLDLLPSDPALGQVRNAVALGSVLWNCFVLEASGKDEDLVEADAIRARVLTTAAEEGVPRDLTADVLAELAERKRTLFSDDRRVIAGVDVRRQGDGFHIEAMSAFT